MRLAYNFIYNAICSKHTSPDAGSIDLLDEKLLEPDDDENDIVTGDDEEVEQDPLTNNKSTPQSALTPADKHESDDELDLIGSPIAPPKSSSKTPAPPLNVKNELPENEDEDGEEERESNRVEQDLMTAEQNDVKEVATEASPHAHASENIPQEVDLRESSVAEAAVDTEMVDGTVQQSANEGPVDQVLQPEARSVMDATDDVHATSATVVENDVSQNDETETVQVADMESSPVYVDDSAKVPTNEEIIKAAGPPTIPLVGSLQDIEGPPPKYYNILPSNVAPAQYPNYNLEDGTFPPPADTRRSTSADTYPFLPEYTLPPLKTLPAEFQRKSKPTKLQRKKEKEREKGENKKDRDDWVPLGVVRWGINIRANPVHKKVTRATKCLTTREWTVRVFP